VRLAGSPEEVVTGAARYRLAEIRRAWGDYAAAEEAYRQASEWGHDPCPGLALLRLAQGDKSAAQAVIRRALSETTEPLHRARLLPAYVEIMLDAADARAAASAADEMDGIAERYGTPALHAVARYTRGAVLLAEDDPAGALVALRAAATLWRDLEVPYEVARTRVLIALACRQMGDQDSARLDLDAAARMFDRLGAEPDRARVAALVAVGPTHGLTDRELEVLRLVATGRTNHAIATELSLAEKTIERHVSNMFSKLGVASRAAATAYAYQHKLV
jgi:DNA-binding NarL/FixJ family response regulator